MRKDPTAPDDYSQVRSSTNILKLAKESLLASDDIVVAGMELFPLCMLAIASLRIVCALPLDQSDTTRCAKEGANVTGAEKIQAASLADFK